MTSLIATLEPIVAWAEEHKGIQRNTTTLVIGVSAWLLGFGTIFSFSDLSDFYPLGFLPVLNELNIFELTEYLSITILLPVSGLLIAVFAAWIIPRTSSYEELSFSSDLVYSIWLFLIRWLGPVVVTGIFLTNIF